MDYRGDVGVIIINHSDETVGFANGDRIAQAVLKQVDQIEWETVEELPTSVRGIGGFGSTGIDMNMGKVRGTPFDENIGGDTTNLD